MCFIITIWQHFASKKCGSCVAGGPGPVSIVNTHYIQGVSLHGFPSDEKDRKQRRQRNKFVIKALTVFRAPLYRGETKNLGISAALGLKNNYIRKILESLLL